MKEIKLVSDITVFPNGYTPVDGKAGDILSVSDELADSMVRDGQATDASASAAAAEPKAKTPEQMTKPELAAYAAEQGITLDATKTKAEMLTQYEAELAAKAK